MARPRASFQANIGRRRLTAGISASEVSDTRSARAGMAQIIKNYRKFVHNVEEAVPTVLLMALEPTFELSLEYCPKDTGAMAASGYLEATDFRGKPRVEMGYGRGGEPEYTAKVHENMEYKHKAPTRAKWLQIALQEDGPNVQRRIVAALKV